MFIGHYAPALAVAGLVRRPRLGPLFLAAQFADIVLFLLVLVGIEHVGIAPGLTVMSPLDFWDVRWSHSLVGMLGCAAAFTIAVKLLTRDARAAWIAGGMVASHWFLDLVVHPPDLTWAGVGTRYGWGLWDYPVIEMPLELLATFLAFAFYLARTRADDWRGRAAPVLLAVVAVALQLRLWLAPQPVAAAFRAPDALAISGLAMLTAVTVVAWWTGDLRARLPVPQAQRSVLPSF